MASKISRIVCKPSNAPTRPIIFEANLLARLADGSSTCSLGDTSVLVTTSCPKNQKPNAASFVPLTVDYRQKSAAAGRIPMTHHRRETGPTEKEILTSRMIDRSIRPGFSKGFSYETQVNCNLLAVDSVHDPDVMAINGASACLAISDIPWNGPIGAVRLGLIKDKPIVNPTRFELNNSRVNLVIAANEVGNITMMDGSCSEPIQAVEIHKILKQGVTACKSICESIQKLQKEVGKPKRQIELVKPSQDMIDFVQSIAQSRIIDVLSNHSLDKSSRGDAIDSIRSEVIEQFDLKFPDAPSGIFLQAYAQIVGDTYRYMLANNHKRCDGRKHNQMRPISCAVDLYKPLHGSAMFQRGQTQVLCSTTFDSQEAAFRSDYVTLLTSGIKEKNFMLHYEFPPYATNEIGKSSGPKRRDIGHGALAEKSLRPLVPDGQDMTIRLNCEVLESNGSSSMASVCAGSLSLMDAGVELEEHVAGVAIGYIKRQDENNDGKIQEESILTDIMGFEDFFGDMDFKIAGTKRGTTALQLDAKPTEGIPISIIRIALRRANQAIVDIIKKMDQAIAEPRKEKKPNHPVIKTIHVPPHKRAKFIGFGGSNIKKLLAQIGVRVTALDIVEDDAVGSTPQENFVIFAPNTDAMLEAEEFIKNALDSGYKEPELDFNGIYTATIQEVRENGVMVTLYPNMIPTLLSLSQLDVKTVRHPSALGLEVGQQIQVKYFGRDPATGQMRISRKSLMVSSAPRAAKDLTNRASS